MKQHINNPILKGFTPDPSIIRVDKDYFIATSTFEWFPGVQIHHSQDLVNWQLLKRPLDRVSQLDMKGNHDSGGVWAPCLTYYDGTYYLIYSDMKSAFQSRWMDVHNYLVTTDDIEGDWSDPVFLNSSGFDPSLFHDDDGRKWLVNMVWDSRPDKNSFGGIFLQEYSPEAKKLIGPVYNIFQGTDLRVTEGPHIYKLNGYYYLLTAEGGTGYNHAVTIARSKNITGPYEVHPENPILTAKDDPDNPLQKAGHGDLVETSTGEWYLVHLCSRPLTKRGNCNLGRETAIQKIIWKNDWPYLDKDNNTPEVQVAPPDLPEVTWSAEPEKDDFDNNKLNIHFQTLRIPLSEDMMSLKERQGYLRLKGKESLSSLHSQSLVARRQQSFYYTAETCLEFEPDNFKQMAGLVCYYNTSMYYYLYISYNEESGKFLNLITCDNKKFEEPLSEVINLTDVDRVYLQVQVDYDKLQFYYSQDGKEWIVIGPVLDAGKLSDDYVEGHAFTGAFVGMCCQDLSGQSKPADFDYFVYKERDE